MADFPTLEDLRKGGPTGKGAMARALTAIERSAGSDEAIALLDKAWREARGHVVGLTGPPGVGKSTLINAMISHWRSEGRTVGVIAVDPSSRRTGGALLGDRARLKTDPEDNGVFIRSMAARDRLGGLAGLTVAAMVLMRAVYDVVLVETVGVGQSETDVSDVADTVVFCIQPGSGDSLQFMKAGIMEIPHIAVVTKSDMGASARRALSDVEGALGLSDETDAGWPVPVEMVSASTGEGISDLLGKIDTHRDWLAEQGRLESTRAAQSQVWLVSSLREKFGSDGLEKSGDWITQAKGHSPFRAENDIRQKLEVKI